MMNPRRQLVHQVEQSEDEPRDEPSLAKAESHMEELIRLRLQVKNIEDLANYRGELLNEGRPAGATAPRQLGHQS